MTRIFPWRDVLRENQGVASHSSLQRFEPDFSISLGVSLRMRLQILSDSWPFFAEVWVRPMTSNRGELKLGSRTNLQLSTLRLLV